MKFNKNISIALQAIIGTVVAMVFTSILLNLFDMMHLDIAQSGTFCNILLDCMILLVQIIILLRYSNGNILLNAGIDFKKVKGRRFGQVIVAALLVVILAYVSITISGTISFEGTGFDNFSILSIVGVVIELFIQMVFVAVAEEVLFRGVIASNLRKALGDTSALLISTLIFTVFHCTVIHSVTQVTDIFVLGIILGALYIKTNTIVYSIGFHFIIDFVTNLVGLKGSKALLLISTETSEGRVEAILFGMMTVFGIALIAVYIIRKCIYKKKIKA